MEKTNKLSGRKIFVVLSLFALIISLSACGMNSTTDSNISMESIADRGENMNYSLDVAYNDEIAELSKSEAPMDDSIGFTDGSNGYIQEYDQMIIYNGDLYIEVDDIDSASNMIKSSISTSNGYLMNSNQWENEESIHVRYEFKVPVDGFYPLIDQINEMEIGKVTNQYIGGNDVTEEYYDLDSRLKAKRVYEERLLELFATAEKTEDLLMISNDLSRVQEEIEQLEGRQNFLSYHTSNSTLSIEMVQYKDKVAPSASTWEKAIDSLKQSLEFLKDLSVSIFVGLFGILPILILLGIIALVVVIIIRKNIRKNRKIKSSDKDPQDSSTNDLE